MVENKRLIAAAATIALAMCGCLEVHEARRAQREIEGKIAGVQRKATVENYAPRTLEEHVGYALEHRPSMLSAWLDVEDARLRMKEIAADAPLASDTPWNAISASGNLGHSEQSDAAHFDKLKKKTHGQASGGISFDILLWDFGRNQAEKMAQAERTIAAELDADKTGYTIFGEVANAYFSHLEAYALLEVSLTNLQMRAEHLAQAEERLSAGEAQKLDVLRARLDWTEAREAFVAASNDCATAAAQLANAVGLEADIAHLIAPGAGTFSDATRVFEDTLVSSHELFEFARTNAPAPRAVRARLAAASRAVDFAVADLMPKISASVSFNWTDPLWVWRWGINGVQSLFSGFSKVTAVERAVVAMDKAAADVDETELALALNIELAAIERDNAREAYSTAQASVTSAKENLDTVTEQFLVGDVSRVEYTDAVADYASALANRVKAFYRGQKAEAKLFELTGVRPTYYE